MNDKATFYYIALLIVCVIIGNRIGALLYALFGVWSIPLTAVAGWWLWQNHERVNDWMKAALFND